MMTSHGGIQGLYRGILPGATDHHASGLTLPSYPPEPDPPPSGVVFIVVVAPGTLRAVVSNGFAMIVMTEAQKLVTKLGLRG
jgi:hypothetical protein